MASTKHKAGFTLIELIMILVLIGIIATAIVPKFTAVRETKAATFTMKLRADIRYAQNLAMTRNARYRVYFNSAPAPNPGYAVTDNGGAIVTDPAGGGNLSVTLNAGDYAGITVAAPYIFIQFDSLGRPYNNAGTLLAAAADLTVSPGPVTVSISPQTGAVN